MSTTLIEFSALVPVIGGATGYTPVRANIKPITDGISEAITSLLTGVERAEDWFQKDRVSIRRYDKDWDETLANMSAPTMVVNDLVRASVLSTKAGMLEEPDPLSIALYGISEVVSPLREFRSAFRKELQKAVKEEENR